MRLNNKSARRDFKANVLPGFTWKYSNLLEIKWYCQYKRGYSNANFRKKPNRQVALLIPDIEARNWDELRKVGTTL